MADKEHVLQVQTVADNYTLVGRPCEISAFSFIPTQRHVPAERTVFNSTKEETGAHNTYDRLFCKVDGYNNKLHRDDREHAKSRGLRVNDEVDVAQSQQSEVEIMLRFEQDSDGLELGDNQVSPKVAFWHIAGKSSVQEKVKEVPSLASSEYGHRLKESLENDLDPPDRKHVRIAYVQAEFYRRNENQ